ncbi:MAG: hypothetical protein HYU49_00055 [Candidatus Levybacteria bacterium]|nr:hypothetical protein [Candidatus Levybacteria bacterium]MBI3092681.1 hypothetical protein [Candidatus Levybacteria bacterium]
MQSLIISAKNQKLAEEYVQKICADYQIDRFDIYNAEEEKGTIGIEKIRNLQKKLFLKPIRSKVKAAVIKNAENLTLEAQNALLKSLEEPPDNTIVILTVSNKDLLVSTILSRCKIIELKEDDAQLPKNEISQYLDILISLRSYGIGERLKLTQDVGKTKEEALLWLEKMILITRGHLIETVEKNGSRFNDLNLPAGKAGHFSKDGFSAYQHLSLLISLQKSYVILKTTNANPRFTLETLLLNS